MKVRAVIQKIRNLPGVSASFVCNHSGLVLGGEVPSNYTLKSVETIAASGMQALTILNSENPNTSYHEIRLESGKDTILIIDQGRLLLFVLINAKLQVPQISKALKHYLSPDCTFSPDAWVKVPPMESTPQKDRSHRPHLTTQN